MGLYKLSSRWWSLVVFPFFEVVVFSFDSLCTLRIEPLWIMFFARFTGRRSEKKSIPSLIALAMKVAKEEGSLEKPEY